MKYSKKSTTITVMMNECLIFVSIYQVPRANLSFVSVTAFVPRLLTYWLNKYQIEDKDMGESSKPVNSDAIDSSISETRKNYRYCVLRTVNFIGLLLMRVYVTRRCEELINLAESTYHIKVRKNSDAK